LFFDCARSNENGGRAGKGGGGHLSNSALKGGEKKKKGNALCPTGEREKKASSDRLYPQLKDRKGKKPQRLMMKRERERKGKQVRKECIGEMERKKKKKNLPAAYQWDAGGYQKRQSRLFLREGKGKKGKNIFATP